MGKVTTSNINMNAQTFTKCLLGAIVVVFMLVGVVNYIINPFAHFHTSGNNYFKKHRSRIHLNSSIAKAQAVTFYRPKSLILGSSRAELGLDPEHSAWSNDSRPTYNLVLARGTMLNIYNYFLHAQRV